MLYSGHCWPISIHPDSMCKYSSGRRQKWLFEFSSHVRRDVMALGIITTYSLFPRTSARPMLLRSPRAPDTVSIVNTRTLGDTWLPQGSSLLAQSDLFIGQWISKSPAIGCTVPRPQTFDSAKLMIRQKVKFLFVFQSFSPFLHSKWCRKKVVKWGFLTLRKIRVNGLPFDIYISFSFYWCALDQQVTRKTLSNFSWTDFLFVSHCLWLCWLLTNQKPPF